MWFFYVDIFEGSGLDDLFEDVLGELKSLSFRNVFFVIVIFRLNFIRMLFFWIRYVGI